MGTTQAMGRAAKSLAVAYLETLGWRIRGRNLRRCGVEIDVLAEEKQTVVIVEVKYRGRADYGGAAQALGRGQQERLRRAAHAMEQAGDRSVRIDLVTIEPVPDGVLVRHYRNAVED